MRSALNESRFIQGRDERRARARAIPALKMTPRMLYTASFFPPSRVSKSTAYFDYKVSSSPPLRDTSQEFDPLKPSGSGTSLFLARNDTSGLLSHIGSRLTPSIPARIIAPRRNAYVVGARNQMRIKCAVEFIARMLKFMR